METTRLVQLTSGQCLLFATRPKFLDWNKAELQTLDRTTRKLLTSHNALHPRSNVDRIYLPRDKGGKGLKQI